MRILILLYSILIIQLAEAQNLLSIGGKNFFLNGANIAWNNYGWDFGDNSAGYGGGNGYDPLWWENTFSDIENYGGNCVRVWVHCKGEHNPLFDANHNCTGLNNQFFDNLDDMLDRAENHNLMVILCLFDFYMTDFGRHAIIKDTSKTKKYINHALIPMVQRYQNQCNLIAWEIINEPEWIMGGLPGAGNHGGGPVTITEMQRFVGMCAAAVHTHSNKPVTVGSASLKWNSDISPASGNYWKDASIKSAAYNDPKAYLDFYQIHYYDWMLTGNNFAPYNRSRSSWGLDKPTLVGETGNEGYYTYQQQFDYSYSNGYAGCLIWAYKSGGAATWTDFNSKMKNFRDNNQNVVDFSCAVLPIDHLQKNKSFSAQTFIHSGEDLIIRFDENQDLSVLKIADLKGNVVLRKEIIGQNEIILSQNIASGIYLIILEGKESVQFKKLVVE